MIGRPRVLNRDPAAIEAGMVRVRAGEAVATVAKEMGLAGRPIYEAAHAEGLVRTPARPPVLENDKFVLFRDDTGKIARVLMSVLMSVLNGKWPEGSFKTRRRRAVYTD